MLRRVKKDVEKEMGKKLEYKLLCSLTSYQLKLYKSLKETLSLKGIF